LPRPSLALAWGGFGKLVGLKPSSRWPSPWTTTGHEKDEEKIKEKNRKFGSILKLFLETKKQLFSTS